jgi:hypothetical protein
MITGSTAHIESQSLRVYLGVGLAGWNNGKNEAAIGKGGVVWTWQAQVERTPRN